jgi:hypothetical protein
VRRPAPAVLLFLTLIALGARAGSAAAQGAPMSVEARVGLAVPVSSFADASREGGGASPGAGFGVEVTLGGTGWHTLYAGFSQLRFACANAGCPEGDPYVATGVNAGVRVTLHRGHRVLPWVGAGVLTTRVESPATRTSDAGVSNLGVGGEVSAGLWVGAGRSLAFSPGVRWSRVGTELPGGASLPLRYVVVDLGLALTF